MLNQHSDITELAKKAELKKGRYWEGIILIGVVMLIIQHWVWIRSWFDDSTGSMIGILVILLIAFIYKSFRNKLLTHHYIFKWISGGMFLFYADASVGHVFIKDFWGYPFHQMLLTPLIMVLLAYAFVYKLEEFIKSLIDSPDRST